MDKHLRLALIGALTLSMLGGCKYLEGDDDDDDDRVSERVETSRAPSTIPRNARLMDSGEGEITATAPNDGEVWIYDAGERQVVYKGSVRENEVVRVEPEQDRVTIDGKVVFDRNLERRNEHRIYFEDRSRTRTLDRDRDRGRVRDRDRDVNIDLD